MDLVNNFAEIDCCAVKIDCQWDRCVTGPTSVWRGSHLHFLAGSS